MGESSTRIKRGVVNEISTYFLLHKTYIRIFKRVIDPIENQLVSNQYPPLPFQVVYEARCRKENTKYHTTQYATRKLGIVDVIKTLLWKNVLTTGFEKAS